MTGLVRCNHAMLLLFPLRPGLGATRFIEAGLIAMLTGAGWQTAAQAQTALSDPASPQAPPSVIAPPRPTPGDGQSKALRERLVMQAFEQADRNHDGLLSPEEAASLPGLPERFGKVDSNRDGLISREEFKAAGGP